MSNPTPVINFADSLAQFLARTNQFGEPNQDLVQQKFNKKQADGSLSPVFAALESRSRAVAQWANMVDDFIVQFFTDQIAAGGAAQYPIFTMSMATNAPQFLPWGSENFEGSVIVFGRRYIVPFDCRITGFVVRSSGSLIPGVSTFQVTDMAAASIGAAFNVDIMANGVVYETAPLSVDVDRNVAIAVRFDPALSPSGEVLGHMIVEPR